MPQTDLRVELSGKRSYPVVFGPLSKVPVLMEECGLRKGNCLVVTDNNIAALHWPALRSSLESGGWTPHVHAITPGEMSKSPGSLQKVYDFALAAGIDRQTPVLALGGGVVGDVAGYAAATLLRGLPLVQLPTSLIAQVDSAIGGKTGINHSAGKNLIGAFHQPELVCADQSLLRSLPELEWASGLAEVVKHALIADKELIVDLRDNWSDIQDRRGTVVEEIVVRAAAIKVAVVSEDEREASRRMILNFGHTFGHAIERVAGYGRFTHGEAVAIGMRAALKVSQLLNPSLPMDELLDLVNKLPVRHTLEGLDLGKLHRAMNRDKKVHAGQIRLVLLKAPGKAYVTGHASAEQIDTGWMFARDANR